MADKKRESEFVVTDRRRFSADGESPAASEPAAEPEAPEKPADPPVATVTVPEPESSHVGAKPETPPPPSVDEQKAGEDAYRESSKQLDDVLRKEIGHARMQDLEMSFERFVASLYMSALMQLGLMREQGATPRVDLVGARQTIDTIGILQEKTKGNLAMNEDAMLRNCLYELRMAYLEVTNALTRPPEPGAGPRPK